MPVNEDIGRRMKEYYEQIPKIKLVRRMPVIIRIDGRSFHSFTKNFVRPFDDVLIKSMQETMKHLCENIQGCVLGYQQSDEISLVLVDYKSLNSSAFFDYEAQKICSITASMATMAFNKYYKQNIQVYNLPSSIDFMPKEKQEILINQHRTYFSKIDSAMFDSRCFNVPKEEVTNYFYWRQLDAIRNSIQMVGQANFTHKEIQNKSCRNIEDMLLKQKGINWNDLPIYQQRGCCCIKEEYQNENVIRTHWTVDKGIPIFKDEGREYIDRLIFVGE